MTDTFHDRFGGTGAMEEYTINTFQDGAIYTAYDGHRDAATNPKNVT